MISRLEVSLTMTDLSCSQQGNHHDILFLSILIELIMESYRGLGVGSSMFEIVSAMKSYSDVFYAASYMGSARIVLVGKNTSPF